MSEVPAPSPVHPPFNLAPGRSAPARWPQEEHGPALSWPPWHAAPGPPPPHLGGRPPERSPHQDVRAGHLQAVVGGSWPTTARWPQGGARPPCLPAPPGWGTPALEYQGRTVGRAPAQLRGELRPRRPPPISPPPGSGPFVSAERVRRAGALGPVAVSAADGGGRRAQLWQAGRHSFQRVPWPDCRRWPARRGASSAVDGEETNPEESLLLLGSFPSTRGRGYLSEAGDIQRELNWQGSSRTRFGIFGETEFWAGNRQSTGYNEEGPMAEDLSQVPERP